MTPDEIIELADRRTERRGKNVLDLPKELLSVISDMCMAERWFWRRYRQVVNTVADTATYDLLAGTKGIGFDQMATRPRIVLGGNQFQELVPIFDVDTQEMAIEDETTGEPLNYFIDPGTHSTIRLTPIPGTAYKIIFPFWASPTDFGADDNTVPLVPPHLHPVIVKGLEAQIERYAIGSNPSRYMAAKAEYEAMLKTSQIRTDFAQGNARNWNSDEESVRSL